MQITINDKKYTLQWGMGAIEIFCDIMGCDMEALALIGTGTLIEQTKTLTTLIFSAVRNGLEIEGKDIDVNYRQLQLALDKMPQSEFQDIMKDFENSQYMGISLRQFLYGDLPEESNDKKKKAKASKLPKS